MNKEKLVFPLRDDFLLTSLLSAPALSAHYTTKRGTSNAAACTVQSDRKSKSGFPLLFWPKAQIEAVGVITFYLFKHETLSNGNSEHTKMVLQRLGGQSFLTY